MGVGAAYSFTDSIAVFIDYVDFQDDTIDFSGVNTSGTFDHAFDSINLGVTYQF
jgi:opacity protein-like surface antigen